MVTEMNGLKVGDTVLCLNRFEHDPSRNFYTVGVIHSFGVGFLFPIIVDERRGAAYMMSFEPDEVVVIPAASDENGFDALRKLSRALA
jgi:hypothetical protein